MNKFLFGKNDIEFFLNITGHAGDIALQMQKSGLDVKRKDDNSIITEADVAAQNYLIEQISGKYGDFRIISEEKGNSGNGLTDDNISVIIDPIDGTAMYSMYLPIWCVSIGIFRGFEPLYGFVYSPGSDLFFHSDNDGSYLNGRKLTAEVITDIERETNIFYSSEIRGIKMNFRGKARNLGSTALHACLTADNRRNRLLAFIGKSYLWDWAGAIPIMLKAGVKLKYLNGRDIDYAKIIENGFELEDYAVAYNTEDFETVKRIFSRED